MERFAKGYLAIRTIKNPFNPMAYPSPTGRAVPTILETVLCKPRGDLRSAFGYTEEHVQSARLDVPPARRQHTGCRNSTPSAPRASLSSRPIGRGSLKLLFAYKQTSGRL